MALVALAAVGGPAPTSARATAVNALCVLTSAVLVIWAWWKHPSSSRAGQWAIGCLAGFVLVSIISITWSVDPMATWDELNRLMAYFAVFAAAVVLARSVPERWRVLLLGLAIGAVAMSALAMASKMFPAVFAPREQYARLREPLQYWNAVGLLGAFGIPFWLYFGTRRQGRPIIDILAAPVLSLLFVTVLLAYSRGALLAALVGMGLWFLFAPCRLKSVAVIVPALGGAIVILLWAFGQPDLTKDGIGILGRNTAGHRFAVVVAATLIVVTLASLVVQFLIAARPPGSSLRRRLGLVLLVGVLLVPVAGVVAVAESQQGLGGTISKSWKQLTDPETNSQSYSSPANDPSRLAAFGNARSIYWRDAIRVWRSHNLFGVGANAYGTARLRVRDNGVEVAHAHGFVVQVLADLGLIGVALIVALVVSWLLAARRPLGVRNQPWPEERVAAVALFAAVVTYGVHSSIDWTWSFPAATVPMLIAAGWLAGRGSIALTGAPRAVAIPAEIPATRGARLAHLAPRVGVGVIAVIAVWSIQQPYRAFQTTQSALQAVAAGNTAKAVELGVKAERQAPVSLGAASAHATALAAGADIEGGRTVLLRAIARQPENPAAWKVLLDYELGPAADPKRAAAAYHAAFYLDPQSTSLQATIQAALSTPAPAAEPAAAPAAPAP